MIPVNARVRLYTIIRLHAWEVVGAGGYYCQGSGQVGSCSSNKLFEANFFIRYSCYCTVSASTFKSSASFHIS